MKNFRFCIYSQNNIFLLALHISNLSINGKSKIFVLLEMTVSTKKLLNNRRQHGKRADIQKHVKFSDIHPFHGGFHFVEISM